MPDSGREAEYAFAVDEGWLKLPAEYSLGDVGGVGVDRDDNVYIFHRGEHPIIVVDPDGEFLRSWGDDIVVQAHGLTMGPDDTVYLADTGRHTVTKCTLDGEVLLEIGTAGRSQPYMSGLPFNRCTHCAISLDGEIFVTDGYGNNRVHVYSASGEYLRSWGEPGCEPGQFNVPHNIVIDASGLLYVADRENHRIQVFDSRGRFQAQWHDLHRPCALAIDPTVPDRFYIGEAGPGLPVNVNTRGLGQRVLVTTSLGARVGRYGSGAFGEGPEDFVAPHGIAVDSRGNLYVGEVANLAWTDFTSGAAPDHAVRSFRKLRRV